MLQEIKNILEQVKGVPGLSQSLADSANIIEDVGLDSLEMMQFMLELESQLAIEINFENLDFSDFQSIEKFGKFLTGMKNN
ncbi:phosphopantetheine-binding protein [uncultured Nostoc sp.]|uniref:phosphopantetheine-binding protein n=1 Tax=uncultured Nostoc sp. TaxID=340711 RepID=UPI0035CBC0B1